jgi:nucleoid-associated protein YgaU
MRLPLFLSLLLLAGCAGSGGPSNGLIVTRDGRLVAETSEVARDELASTLANKAAEAAGKDWKATTTIAELPVLNAINADEFGWPVMSVALTLVPPLASTDSVAARTRAEDAIRTGARYRVRRSTDISITTTVLEAGTPAPGSSKYTVVAGDTWTGIANAFYGSTQNWRVIADANPATELKPGTELVIPPKP